MSVPFYLFLGRDDNLEHFVIGLNCIEQAAASRVFDTGK